MAELGTQPALGQLHKLFCFRVESGSAPRIERISEIDPKRLSGVCYRQAFDVGG
jgi:hypothetical protein